MKTTLHGRCLCGSVRYEYTGEVINAMLFSELGKCIQALVNLNRTIKLNTEDAYVNNLKYDGR